MRWGSQAFIPGRLLRMGQRKTRQLTSGGHPKDSEGLGDDFVNTAPGARPRLPGAPKAAGSTPHAPQAAQRP